LILVLEPYAGSPLGDLIARAGERRGLEVLRWSPTMMVDAVSVSLAIDDARTSVTFEVDGRRLEGRALTGAITLFDAFAPTLWPRYAPRDRCYAATEALAVWVAILAALPCAVLNPPAADALGGAILTPVEVGLRVWEVGLAAPSVTYLETARALADAHADEVRASACALGRLPLHEVPLGRAWLTAAADEPIRVRGAGRSRSRAVVIGERVLGVSGDGPPPPVAAALIELHRRLERVVGEVWLSRDDDGRWLVEDVMRWPSEVAAAELGERLGDALVAACEEGRRW
jgi:hypothetical protein